MKKIVNSITGTGYVATIVILALWLLLVLSSTSSGDSHIDPYTGDMYRFFDHDCNMVLWVNEDGFMVGWPIGPADSSANLILTCTPEDLQSE